MISLEDRKSWPKIGSTWEHRNGNLYRVVMYTNRAIDRQDDYPTTIVYQNVRNKEDYSRKLVDWERSMTWIADHAEWVYLIDASQSAHEHDRSEPSEQDRQ